MKQARVSLYVTASLVAEKLSQTGISRQGTTLVVPQMPQKKSGL
jgi:hypothetical protein